MVNRLGLKGNTLIIYAIIYGFSQDGESEYHGSMRYIADTLDISKGGVKKCIDKLLELEIIVISSADKVNGNKYQAVNKVNAAVHKVNASRSLNGTNNNNPTYNLSNSDDKSSSSHGSQEELDQSRGKKTAGSFRDERRVEAGKPPMEKKKITQEQRRTFAAVGLAEYFRHYASEYTGKTYFSHPEDMKSVKSANGKMHKAMKAFYRRCDFDLPKARAIIIWFFENEDYAWTEYEPNHCFMVKTVNDYENRDKKTQKPAKSFQEKAEQASKDSFDNVAEITIPK